MDLCKVKTGGTPSRQSKEYWDNGTIPWVKTTEVKTCIINDTEEKITQIGSNNSNTEIFPKESIIIAMYGQGKTRGLTAKLGIPATTNQACAVLLPSDKYLTDYLWSYLILSYDRLRNLGRGGNQPNLNLDIVKNFEVFVPDIKLQRKFCDKVNDINKMIKIQTDTKNQINRLFLSLIQSAYKGELIC